MSYMIIKYAIKISNYCIKKYKMNKQKLHKMIAFFDKVNME